MELSCCHLPQFLRFGDFVTYSTSSSSFFASSRPISFQSIFCNRNSLIRSPPRRCQQQQHHHHHHHSRRHHRYKMSTCADHVSPRAVSNDAQQPWYISKTHPCFLSFKLTFSFFLLVPRNFDKFDNFVVYILLFLMNVARVRENTLKRRTQMSYMTEIWFKYTLN